MTTSSMTRPLSLLVASALAAGAMTAAVTGPAAGRATAGSDGAGSNVAVSKGAVPKEPVNSCNSRDNTNPGINLLRLSPSTLDVTGGGKKLTVRAKLSDAGGPGPASGVSGATVTLEAASSLTTFNVSLRRAKKPFVWTATQFFPSGITPGAWRVSTVFITDKGDGRTFTEMVLAEKHELSHRGRALRALAAELAPFTSS